MADPAAIAFARNIARWRADPVLQVVEEFGATPDNWQADALRLFPTSPRLALKAAKGPGKTALLAWIAWNFLSTRRNAQAAACSISWDNLNDGLRKEMAIWQAKSEFLSTAFTLRNEHVFANENPKAWFLSFRGWSRDADATAQESTLAGLHAQYMLCLMDETGAMPTAVMAAADAVLANALGEKDSSGRYTWLKNADGQVMEAHVVQAGNPLEASGPLYRACQVERELWDVVEINGDPESPRRSQRMSITWCREQIKRFGRNNAWVQANVFGNFPRTGLRALLGPDQVVDAMARKLLTPVYAHMPKIIGVDVALEGDDRTVIWCRQGLFNLEPIVLRNLEPNEIAARVAQVWHDWDADGCCVDNSGGYGSGVVDHLRLMKLRPHAINFAGAARDPRYTNIRAQMHFEAAEAVKGGCQLPDTEPELVKELTTSRYGLRGGCFYIEDKAHIKQRLGFSPDLADAFALTYAVLFGPRRRGTLGPARRPRGPRMRDNYYDPRERRRAA